MKGSAVDEGRNPYGKPNRGNFSEAWTKLQQIPCGICGSTEKRIMIEGSKVTITCASKKRILLSERV